MRNEQIMLPQIDRVFDNLGNGGADETLVRSDTPHLSPNHLLMALALEYAVLGWRGALIDWFEGQARSFLRREQAGYHEFYERAMALITRISHLKGDTEMHAQAMRWWRIYAAYCDLCRVAGGRVLIPGPRLGNPHHQGPWSECRDYVFGLLTGRSLLYKPESWWETENNRAAQMMRSLVRAEQVDIVPPNERFLPRLRDRLVVKEYKEGKSARITMFGPHEGGPVWSYVAGLLGQMIDMVSWRSLGFSWDQVKHSTIAGFTEPRPPKIPDDWHLINETVLDETRPIPPLPFDIPDTSPVSPSPPTLTPTRTPPTDEEVSKMTAGQIIRMLARHPGIDAWHSATEVRLRNVVLNLPLALRDQLVAEG